MSVSQSPAGVAGCAEPSGFLAGSGVEGPGGAFNSTVDQLPTDEPLGLPRQDGEASDATIEALDWDRPDHLFHLPLDILHARRVESGLTWRTLCGQVRPPARQSHFSFGDLPEDCGRCDELDQR